MKILSLVILSSLLISGNLCIDKFEIIETTSQKWFGGQRNSGSGTNYEINIVPKVNSEQLQFDRAWVGDSFFEIQTFQKGKKMKNNLFSVGDTITIIINDRTVSKPVSLVEKETSLTEKPEKPFEYEGIAIISYTYKNKRKYKEIKSFTELKELMYP